MRLTTAVLGAAADVDDDVVAVVVWLAALWFPSAVVEVLDAETENGLGFPCAAMDVLGAETDDGLWGSGAAAAVAKRG